MSDFSKLKVVELRAELSKRGLPQAGKRDELIERLEEYEFQHAEPSSMDVEIEDEKSKDVEITSPSPVDNTPIEISPVTTPATLPDESQLQRSQIDIDLEEEKRKARAIRFGLNPEEVAKVDISITVKRLEHALPNRRPRSSWKHKKHAPKVVKN